MVMRIVGDADDVVVDAVGLCRVVEFRHVVGSAHLGLQHDFRIRAHHAAGLGGRLQVFGEVGPCARAVVAAVGIAVAGGPEHAVGNLVARLDEVGLGTGLLQLVQARQGIVEERVGQLGGVGDLAPLRGSAVLPGVGPRVAVVEVEHELEARLLDARAESLDIGQVLPYPLVLMLC